MKIKHCIDADFLFKQDLVPAHRAKTNSNWFSDHDITCMASQLTWPKPHRDSMGYFLEKDMRHQTQQYRWAECHYQSKLGFHNTPAVPQAACLRATLMQ